MAEVPENSLAKDFFEQSYQITDNMGKPLTNVYWSHADRTEPVAGSLYLVHGYGGSPIEPLLKTPMKYGLAHGFDVVAIEGIGLSATCGEKKAITDMTLDRQKAALRCGLEFCRDSLPHIDGKYRVGWVHSMSCRALSDLVVDSDFIRTFFNEVVLNNPYFMAPPKLTSKRQRIMRMDPTGASWQTLAQRVANMSRNIEGKNYTIPTCIFNLAIPLPDKWSLAELNFTKLAHRMSYFIRHMYMRFILGTADNMADYNQNLQFYDGLRVPHKQLVLIDGGNHPLDNKQETYEQFTKVILDLIRENAMERVK